MNDSFFFYSLLIICALVISFFYKKLLVIKKGNLITEEKLNEANDYIIAFKSFTIVTVADKNGIITDANDNFFKISGYSKKEFITRELNLLFTNEYELNEIDKIWKTLNKGKVWQGELKEKTKDNKIYWVDILITPFLNSENEVYKYIAIRKDITCKKEAEKRLNDKILKIQSIEVKEQFLDSMSHEIRTPLNTILGFTDILIESPHTKKQKSSLLTIKKSGVLLLSIINDILDISKLDSGKINLHNDPFNLVNLINDIEESLTLKAQAKKIDFDFYIEPEVPKYILGDSNRLKQVLLNIINNAIKFTKKGFVKTSVSLMKLDLDSVLISFKIEDSGIGIPKDKLNNIFVPFVQSNEYIADNFGGTGLGLTIAQKIVKEFSGEILLDSQVDKGTIFTVNIPFGRLNKNDERDFVNNAKTPEPTNDKVELGLDILVVEDNECNQILVTIRLNSWGCNVDIANNGVEAIEMHHKKKYDLILMDIQMPIMDGYTATKQIRNSPEAEKRNIPIIALTAHASRSDAKKAMEIGFSNYLYKPFDVEKLYKSIKSFCSKEKNTASQRNIALNNPTTKQQHNLIDFSYIESEALNQPQIVKMLIESFDKEFCLFIKDVKQGVFDSDWDAVHSAVHKIKPSIASFKIKSLMVITSELYTKSKTNYKTSSYGDLIHKAEKEFLKIRPFLAEKIKIINNGLEKTVS